MSYNYIDNIVAKNDQVPKTVGDYMVYWGGVVSSQGAKILSTSECISDSYITNLGDTDLTESDWYLFVKMTDGLIMSQWTGAAIPNKVNVVDSIIFDKYKSMELLPKITDCFTPPFINYSDFGVTDRDTMENIIQGLVYNVLSKNRKKYEKLFTALTAEFNPLWNVDGTETTIRTLERDGTETTAKTGTVTDATTGTETNKKTGTETTATTGTDATARTGTETDAKSGFDSLGKTGTVATAKTGTETTRGSGTDTTVKNGQEDKTIDTSKASFNSGTMQPTESVSDNTQYTNLQEQETKDLTDAVTYNTTDTTTNNTTDTQNYNSSNTLTRNTTDTRTANLQDETTHNTTDQLTHNTTDTTTHNTTDKLTLDTIDTERIELTRQGNIGVISTVKLLQEYIDFADQLDFFSIIARDIIENIAYLTY